ncbi:sulfurtransferase [Pedobacter sp. Du54]|uniref:sulfurtransferase n=1 Tax=Pedobacter anseongensis TaxID=3133439 RepID=UPI00309C3C8F
MNQVSPLVNATWLFENANLPQLIVLDASLKSPIKTGQPIENKIIPHALQFDWDAFSDLGNPLPHTFPESPQFTQAAQELGINTNSLVVIYDRAGIYSSARVWWMFLAMGFKNSYVLNGGLPEWLKMGYGYANEYEKPQEKGNFIATFNEDLISNRQQVLAASNDKSKLIIDARSADRFDGKIAEPRPGLRSGHIPNAINIPYETVLFENKIRTKKELEEIFSAVKNKNTPLIFSCGSGVTACIDALAATLIGYNHISVYDGSWSEWGMN